jgi:hypothetical protein
MKNIPNEMEKIVEEFSGQKEYAYLLEFSNNCIVSILYCP